MSEKDDFAKGILTGALIGGLIGVAVGILIAPKSGEETRQELTEKAKDFAEKQLHITDSIAEFNNSTYFTEAKRFYAGTIQTYQLEQGAPPLYAVQLYPDDIAHDESILELVKLLKHTFTIPNAQIAFITGNPQQSFTKMKSTLKSLEFKALTIEQILGSIKYLPLNPSET